MTSTDSNIILPIYCPPWCDRSHKQALEETGDVASAVNHYAGGGGALVSEIRNQVDGRVERPGGGGWELHVEQAPFGRDLAGFSGPATVMVEVRDENRDRIALPLTTGEARVLAAQLLQLADLVEPQRGAVMQLHVIRDATVAAGDFRWLELAHDVVLVLSSDDITDAGSDAVAWCWQEFVDRGYWRDGLPPEVTYRLADLPEGDVARVQSLPHHVTGRLSAQHFTDSPAVTLAEAMRDAPAAAIGRRS